MPIYEDNLPAMAGMRLARGVVRMLKTMDHAPLCEFVPKSGLRVDVVSIAPDGEIWVVECKSSRSDFATDKKWQSYLEWSDRFFWAVDCTFDTTILPADTGIIVADAYSAEAIREAPLTRLPSARRARLTRDIARASMFRLQALLDPLGST